MERLLWVCLGGAVGSGLRYLLSGWVMRQAGPWPGAEGNLSKKKKGGVAAPLVQTALDVPV
jgi:hypothetical protein